MSDFDEAMEELEIDPGASPTVKLRAVCQWHLGDAAWAEQFIEWAEQAGFEVTQSGAWDI